MFLVFIHELDQTGFLSHGSPKQEGWWQKNEFVGSIPYGVAVTMTKTRRPILFSDTMILLLLILFVCITSSVATIDETTRITETRISTSNEKEGQQDDEDALLVQETIRVSRGSRDERVDIAKRVYKSIAGIGIPH